MSRCVWQSLRRQLFYDSNKPGGVIGPALRYSSCVPFSAIYLYDRGEIVMGK